MSPSQVRLAAGYSGRLVRKQGCELPGLAMSVRVLVFAACLLAGLSSFARAEILYVRPDKDAPGTAYLWGGDAITDAVPIRDALEVARWVSGSRPLEIRLVHRP